MKRNCYHSALPRMTSLLERCYMYKPTPRVDIMSCLYAECNTQSPVPALLLTHSCLCTVQSLCRFVVSVLGNLLNVFLETCSTCSWKLVYLKSILCFLESLRSVKKFDTLSEDSEEDVVVPSSRARPSSSRSPPEPKTSYLRSLVERKPSYPKTKESKHTSEIIDSDDEDDDDDVIITSSSQPRRALDSGMVQRTGLSRSSATVTSPRSSESEGRRASLSERLGLTKKKDSLRSEQPSLNSRKASRGSSSRRTSGDARVSTSAQLRVDEDEDEDSDDDIVISGSRNKRKSEDAAERRQSLSKQAAGSKRKIFCTGAQGSSLSRRYIRHAPAQMV